MSDVPLTSSATPSKSCASPQAIEPEDFGADDGEDPAAKALGKKGGAARAKKLTPERKAEIAKQAAEKRWKSQTGG